MLSCCALSPYLQQQHVSCGVEGSTSNITRHTSRVTHALSKVKARSLPRTTCLSLRDVMHEVACSSFSRGRRGLTRTATRTLPVASRTCGDVGTGQGSHLFSSPSAQGDALGDGGEGGCMALRLLLCFANYQTQVQLKRGRFLYDAHPLTPPFPGLRVDSTCCLRRRRCCS